MRTGERAVAKAVGKKVLREAEESIIEHADEAAARRLLHQAQERAKKEAERRAAKEAAETGSEHAADGAQRLRAKDRRAHDQAHAKEQKHPNPDFEEPASEAYGKWRAQQAEKHGGKDARRRLHDSKASGDGDRSKQQLRRDQEDLL